MSNVEIDITMVLYYGCTDLNFDKQGYARECSKGRWREPGVEEPNNRQFCPPAVWRQVSCLMHVEVGGHPCVEHCRPASAQQFPST